MNTSQAAKSTRFRFYASADLIRVDLNDRDTRIELEILGFVMLFGGGRVRNPTD